MSTECSVIETLEILKRTCLGPDRELLKWLMKTGTNIFIYKTVNKDGKKVEHNYLSWILLGLVVTHEFSLADEIISNSKNLICFSLDDIYIGRNLPALKYLLQKQKKYRIEVQRHSLEKVWFLEQALNMLEHKEPENTLLQYLPHHVCPHIQEVVNWINSSFAHTIKNTKDDAYLNYMVEQFCYSLGTCQSSLKHVLRVLFAHNRYDIIDKMFAGYKFYEISFYDVLYGDDYVSLKALLDKYPYTCMFFLESTNNYDCYWASLRRASVEMFHVLSDHFDEDFNWLKSLHKDSLYVGNYALVRAIMEKYPEENYNVIRGGILFSDYQRSLINYHELLQTCLSMAPNNNRRIIKICFKEACVHNQAENAEKILKSYPSVGTWWNIPTGNILGGFTPTTNTDDKTITISPENKKVIELLTTYNIRYTLIIPDEEEDEED